MCPIFFVGLSCIFCLLLLERGGIRMKKMTLVSLAVAALLVVASQAFALVDFNAGKYIYNEKETPGFNYLLKGGLK